MVFPEMPFQSIPALMDGVPKLPPQDIPEKPCEGLTSHQGPTEWWCQRGRERHVGLFPKPSSSPRHNGFLPQSYLATSLSASGHSWSTSNQVQGASPLEPQLCTPLQQAEHKGKPTRTSAPSQTRGFIVSYCGPVSPVFARGPESFLML